MQIGKINEIVNYMYRLWTHIKHSQSILNISYLLSYIFLDSMLIIMQESIITNTVSQLYA